MVHLARDHNLGFDADAARPPEADQALIMRVDLTMARRSLKADWNR